MTTHIAEAADRTGTTSAGRRGLLGAGVFLACALSCCLPLLAAAGAAVGLGTLATGAWALGIGVLVAAGGLALLRRRKRSAAPAGTSACGDGCAC